MTSYYDLRRLDNKSGFIMLPLYYFFFVDDFFIIIIPRTLPFVSFSALWLMAVEPRQITSLQSQNNFI